MLMESWTWMGEKRPKKLGESSRIAGLSPGGTVNIDGDWEMIKPVGLLCLNLGSTSPPLELLFPSSLAAPADAAAAAAGEAMAPARSWEKDLNSSDSGNMFETRVIGPGLNPTPALKNISLNGRGGRDKVGRDGAPVDLDVDGSSSFSDIDPQNNQTEKKV